MTWTDASIEALKYGFNAYRDERGEVRPLVQRHASLPGDWMLEGGRIVPTDRGPGIPADGFRLVRIMPPPPPPDPLATIALDSLTRPA